MTSLVTEDPRYAFNGSFNVLLAIFFLLFVKFTSNLGEKSKDVVQMSVFSLNYVSHP